MVVAVDPDDPRHRRRAPSKTVERLGDPRREVAQQRPAPRRSSTSIASARCRAGRRRPAADLGPRRVAGLQLGDAPGAGERGMQTGGRASRGPRRPRWRTRRSPRRARGARRRAPRRATRTASAPSATNAWATATVAVPSLARHQLREARERRRRPRTRPPRTGTRPAPAPGSSPGCSRRYALSRTASPRTTDVLDWSAPRRRSPAAPCPADHRTRPAGRPARPSARRPAIRVRARSAAIVAALGHRGGQRPPRAVAGRGRAAAAARSGRTCSAARTRRRAGRRATASTCGAPASRTKASSSSIDAIVRPLAAEPAAAARSSRSSRARAASTLARVTPRQRRC